MITNRNGIVLCYNKLNEIVCIYFLFFYGDVTYEIIDLFNETNSNINIKLEYKKEKINEKCSICQENMIGNIKLKFCHHNFHKSCIKEWFKIKQSCPLCRTEFIDEITKCIEVKNRYNLKK